MSAVSAFAHVAADPAHALSLPREAYLSAEVFEAEVAHVFRKEWLAVARAEDVAEPGDYRSFELFGTPLMLVRGRDGDLRALSRVCRHRAMPVAEGAGNTKAFQCPYHLWRYGLDGTLLTAPAMEKSAVFDPADCALPSYPVEVWEGFVFVNLDPGAAPLGPRLARLSQRIEGYRLPDMRVVRTLDYPSAWNWKVMVENFMESYHHIGPHAQTLQPSFPAFGTFARDEPEGAIYSILENPPASEETGHLLVFAVYPCGLFAVQEGDPATVIWGQLDIEGPDRFTMRFHVMVPKRYAGDAELAEGAAAVMDAIHQEDMVACAGVQAGLASPDFRPGPLSHLEGALWQFHRFLADRLSA